MFCSNSMSLWGCSRRFLNTARCRKVYKCTQRCKSFSLSMRNSEKVCQKTQAIMKNTQIKLFTQKKICFLVNLHGFEWCYMHTIFFLLNKNKQNKNITTVIFPNIILQYKFIYMIYYKILMAIWETHSEYIYLIKSQPCHNLYFIWIIPNALICLMLKYASI